MLPIGDDNRGRRSLPLITGLLVAANLAVFLRELQAGDVFVQAWSFTPARFLADPLAGAPTLVSSLFLHGGWLHLLGNMLYLWIFGDNVEDRLGHIRFLLFYLACGIAATVAQFAFFPASHIPMLGASGAIAGVLGAYLLLFPRGRVTMLVFQFVTAVPAWVALGVWIVLQVFSSYGSLASAGSTGGVAYLAHVGGFLAGILLAFPARRG